MQGKRSEAAGPPQPPPKPPKASAHKSQSQSGAAEVKSEKQLQKNVNADETKVSHGMEHKAYDSVDLIDLRSSGSVIAPKSRTSKHPISQKSSQQPVQHDYLTGAFPDVTRFTEDEGNDGDDDDDDENDCYDLEAAPARSYKAFDRRGEMKDTEISSDEEESLYDSSHPPRKARRSQSNFSTTSSTDEVSSLEGGPPRQSAGSRPKAAVQTQEAPRYTHKFQRNLGIVYLLCTAGIVARMVYQYVMKSLHDGLWIRCLAFLYIPAIVLFMLFAILFIVNTVLQLLGPVAHIRRNSQFYSAIPTPPPSNSALLPSVTIQIPVFKESLEGVIMPSIRSLQRAIKHYVHKGGKGNIFVNDDGLQVVSEEERARRIAFYERTGISYVARPPDEVRRRRGLFKKASNMNYCLNVSARVEEIMTQAAATNAPISPADALYQVWSSSEYNREFLAGGDIRIRDLILLVDADTRVPKQCMYKTTPEFLSYEKLAFTQHLTFPMRNDYNYWENTIAHFTETIYFAIMFATSGGDTPPLVGHNAFLRWSSVQAVARDDSRIKGFKLYWAEDRVSEDFDLSLRLLSNNYTGRYITYTGTGFQEGVSLTVHDEIIRLKKYAFGACEMAFNRVSDVMACKGIIAKSYRKFLASKVPWHSKVNITAYLGTYFAMSCAVLAMWTNVALYVFVPGARVELVSSLDISLTCMIIFGGLATVGLGVVKYRLNYRGAADAGVLCTIMNELRHIPVMMLFFNAVPFHLSISTFRYFMGLKMQWGATVKEKELELNCLNYLLTTVKKYQSMYVAMMLMSLGFGAMLYISPTFIHSPQVMVPVCAFIGGHIFGPFILDPTITRMVY